MAYLRQEDVNKRVQCSFGIGKARLAPIREITVMMQRMKNLLLVTGFIAATSCSSLPPELFVGNMSMIPPF